jgi:hypothetical protein
MITTPITAMLSFWDWSLSAGDRSDGMLPYYQKLNRRRLSHPLKGDFHVETCVRRSEPDLALITPQQLLDGGADESGSC